MLPTRCWSLLGGGASSSTSSCRSAFLQATGQSRAMARPSSDMSRFREVLSRARHVVVLTGAGVSAESGVPTFRGTGGYWRTWQSQDLATAAAFQASPSRVWEFYHYRREAVLRAEPNAAHTALARCQRRFAGQGRKLTLVTQNVDELHRRAGSEHVHELHGSLFKTRCTSCGHVESNYNSPITPALQGKGAPDPNTPDAAIPEELLPRKRLRPLSGTNTGSVKMSRHQIDTPPPPTHTLVGKTCKTNNTRRCLNTLDAGKMKGPCRYRCVPQQYRREPLESPSGRPSHTEPSPGWWTANRGGGARASTSRCQVGFAPPTPGPPPLTTDASGAACLRPLNRPLVPGGREGGSRPGRFASSSHGLLRVDSNPHHPFGGVDTLGTILCGGCGGGGGANSGCCFYRYVCTRVC
ncbi:NAD-dependent protein deacylase sirtuin-5, mitochondrial isoform X1 [Petromyzon marinus]|uniref:NAD-dependent protein deacylase sirtuin-5, mitochondrial isoform X1 n=1 Tax=Petromyzon marinus TaxID=7757 RepID=UPI003F6E77F0